MILKLLNHKHKHVIDGMTQFEQKLQNYLTICRRHKNSCL